MNYPALHHTLHFAKSGNVGDGIAIHCYQGYYATGGPEGVGRASGRAIRASIVTVVAADMVLTLLFWGNGAGIRISG